MKKSILAVSLLLMCLPPFTVSADTGTDPNYLVLIGTTTGMEWITPDNIESVTPASDGMILTMSSGQTFRLLERDLLRFSRLVGLTLKPY